MGSTADTDSPAPQRPEARKRETVKQDDSTVRIAGRSAKASRTVSEAPDATIQLKPKAASGTTPPPDATIKLKPEVASGAAPPPDATIQLTPGQAAGTKAAPGTEAPPAATIQLKPEVASGAAPPPDATIQLTPDQAAGTKAAPGTEAPPDATIQLKPEEADGTSGMVPANAEVQARGPSSSDSARMLLARADGPVFEEIGPFAVEEELGHGGMGWVFAARHRQMRRKVALKVLDPGVAKDPDSVERFYREARDMSDLRDPGIVQVLSTGEDKGLHYIEMEYVKGCSLHETLEDGPVDWKAAAAITRAVACALTVAHDKSVIHRDIKPHNIMICDVEPDHPSGQFQQIKEADVQTMATQVGRASSIGVPTAAKTEIKSKAEDQAKTKDQKPGEEAEEEETTGLPEWPLDADGWPQARVKVVDFGLAKNLEQDVTLTKSHEIMGTLAYMSPQQAGGEKLDQRTDIYSLGATLYHMLTGHVPLDFEEVQGMAILARIVTEWPKPVREVCEDVPETLASVLDKMMAKDLGQRYETMQEVLVDLDRVRGGESFRYSIKQIRPGRRWGLAGAASVLAIVLAVGIPLGIQEWRERANAQRKAAAQMQIAAADQALQDGDTQGARAALNEVLKKGGIDPGNPKARVKLEEVNSLAKREGLIKQANAALKEGRPDQAAALFDDAQAPEFLDLEGITGLSTREREAQSQAALAEARRLRSEGGYKAAIAKYEAAAGLAAERKAIDLELVACRAALALSTLISQGRDKLSEGLLGLAEERLAEASTRYAALAEAAEQFEMTLEDPADLLARARFDLAAEAANTAMLKKDAAAAAAALEDVSENARSADDTSRLERLRVELAPLTAKAWADSRLPEGMVWVPALRGVVLGSPDPGDRNKVHTVDVDGFYMDTKEVTNAAFKRFVDADGYANSDLWSETGRSLLEAGKLKDGSGRRGPLGWRDGSYPPGHDHLPVVGVSVFEAKAYARWLERRLPSADEWEVAASVVPDKPRRAFPFGSTFTEGDSNLDTGAAKVAGKHPQDRSGWGCFDMGGNAHEWVATLGPDDLPVLKGGSFKTREKFARPTRNSQVSRDDYRTETTGFRCAADVPQTK